MLTELRHYFSDIFFLIGSDRHKLPWIVASFLLVAMLDLLGLAIVGSYIILLTQSGEATVGLLSTLVNTLKLQDNGQSQLMLGVVLIVIFVIKAVTASWVLRNTFKFSEDQAVRLRSHLSSAIVRMPYQEYISRNSAEFVQALVSYVNQFAGSLVALLRLAAEGIIALTIGFMLLLINGFAVLLLIIIAGILFIAYDRVTGRPTRQAGRSRNQGNELVIKGIQEGVSGLKELRILGHEKYFLNQVQKGSQQAATANVFILLIASIPRYLVEVAVVVFIVGLLSIFMLQGTNLETMYPVIGIMGMAAVRLGPATGLIMQTSATIRSSRHAIASLREELSGMTKVEGHAEMILVPEQRFPFQSLELNRVGFGYPGSTHRAIDEISLTISVGESIGLIGASGVGKTTLVDVILGLLDYQAGEIYYNDMPLAECLQQWRSNAAYLPQEVFLIDASLRNNVALGVEPQNIDDQRLNDALRRASLTDLVSGLPQGIDTKVGERGVRLSGGQRQRVAIARALYHQREVLVMDEATSALDDETEREIVEEIRRLKGHKTMIVIAHRLTTLQHCDRIYRLEQGRVVAVTSYADAVAD